MFEDGFSSDVCSTLGVFTAKRGVDEWRGMLDM